MKFILLFILVLVSNLSFARDPKQVTEFRKTHPCPSTNKTTGACPGWIVDHLVPICFGGMDSPLNMQWQELAQSRIKDKFEMEACALKVALAASKLKCGKN